MFLKRLRNWANFRILTGATTTTIMILGVAWYWKEGGFEPAIAAIVGLAGFLSLFQYSFLSFDRNMTVDRIALVVGNQQYVNTPPLSNSVNDAEEVCKVLKKLGFKVIKRIDPTTSELKKAIYDFQIILSTGGVGLFYYAGHASQINGRDLILPVDVKLNAREEFAEKAIDLNSLLGPIDQIIDESPDHNGSIVIYSTASGKLAFDSFHKPEKDGGSKNAESGTSGYVVTATRHSPFAYAFLDLVDRWNVEIFDLFRELLVRVRDATDGQQIPWLAASVDSEFYFKPLTKEKIGVMKILIFDACRNEPFYRPPVYYTPSEPPRG